jgi:hypothetical protein
VLYVSVARQRLFQKGDPRAEKPLHSRAPGLTVPSMFRIGTEMVRLETKAKWRKL